MKKFRIMAVVAALVAEVCLFSTTPIVAQAARTTTIEGEILDKINSERSKAGLKALSYDSKMEKAADTRAVEADQKWSHIRPDGSEYWTVDETIYGENLSKDYSSADATVKGWMNSQAHKDNILFKDFRTCAVGVLAKGDGTYVIALEFGY